MEANMLTPIELALHSFVFLLIPIALYSLWAGSPIPNEPGGDYFRAVKGLRLCGDLFLLAVCAVSTARLAIHFGFISPSYGETVLTYLGFPFMTLLVIYLALFARAAILVHRGNCRDLPQ
jgi:hypothetical protein